MTGSALIAAAAVAALVVAPSADAIAPRDGVSPAVRVWTIEYRAHDGLLRQAYVLLPRWYGPGDDPRIPLVISPHGRGVEAIDNAAIWGALPALGRFAVVNPDGQGRALELYSWGDPGEIDDLARMPQLVTQALPWLRVDLRRIYAVGGSMGGQEALLLVARHPRLLAGAAAFDAPVNMALRYRDFRRLRHGLLLQRLARAEIGGTPSSDAQGYRLRSPLDFVRRIAFSGVPLQLWWSRLDRVVVDQARQTGLLYREIERLNPLAPVRDFVGEWAHTAEMRATTRLPIALGLFDLLPPSRSHFGGGVLLQPAERRPDAANTLASRQHLPPPVTGSAHRVHRA
jgi:pimeloyl-ACP methyl ester carboxylesterase